MKTLLLFLLLASGLLAATGDQAIGKPVTFSVANDGTAPFTYQWAKNGVAIPGATAATYYIAAVGVTDAGIYTVQVSNKAGTVNSDKAVFTISVTPTTATVSIATP